ncbi:MAG: Gfo/Idh/MocA family oxidoreductase [Aquihabitans sp.]
MGANHARVYSGLKGAVLAAVVDADAERAASVAAQYGGVALTSPSELAGLVDAASIAVPSSLHLPVGVELLGMGIDCLVEKPLAVTPADGRALADAAKKAQRTLLVGHIEQFNPAVEQLTRILRGGSTVRAIDARRMSAVSSRITDVDVVADLMIHDIEIVLNLVGQDVIDVVARGVNAAEGDSLAYVTALLTFSDGTLASLTASRITQNQVRELQVTTEDRLFEVDYAAQELRIYRQGRIGMLDTGDLADGQYVLDVGTEQVFVRRSEPLYAELTHFLACIRGEETPRVDGDRAVRAIEIAAQITELAKGLTI